jgi:hypothetical protein
VPGVYLRHGENFVAMRETPYETEDLLQALIAEHPEILAEDEGGERGWVLVKRESGVPDRPDGADRWSLDHLLLDHAGIPTLVEVKRSSDTRARREVVAQMLDYAANSTAHWKVDSVRTWFEAEHPDPQGKLREAFDVTDYEAYWETVKTNLAAERIRLVFVADEIAPELRSIIEFLNRQMTETEVLAIEVKQYVDADGERQTIVPRVLGQTEAARAVKRGARQPAREWDEQSMLGDSRQRRGDAVASVAESIISWAQAREAARVTYGKGALYGSVHIRREQDGQPPLTIARIYSSGFIEIPVRLVAETEIRDELRRRLEDVVPTISEGPVPNLDLVVLLDDRTRLRFLEVLEWMLEPR